MCRPLPADLTASILLLSRFGEGTAFVIAHLWPPALPAPRGSRLAAVLAGQPADTAFMGSLHLPERAVRAAAVWLQNLLQRRVIRRVVLRAFEYLALREEEAATIELMFRLLPGKCVLDSTDVIPELIPCDEVD